MEILGIGFPELVLILIIALIVVGPRDLGKVGRQIGRFLNRLYRSESWRTLNEASRTLRTLPNRLAREAALEELDQTVKDIKKAGKPAQDELEKAASDLSQGLRAWTPPVKDQPADSQQTPTNGGQQQSEQPPQPGEPDE